jgi:glycosyltransferase involved in cell wall biosynthesis
MNVLMLTNNYLPVVGGVSRSVDTFAQALKRRGHRVLVVAPAYDDAPAEEDGVIRVPALQHLTSHDAAVSLPMPGYLTASVTDFQPDVVHVHHPFFLGDTGLRIAARQNLPVVFTHHTMYEQYTHYLPANLPAMERFTIRLVTEFANHCDHVIAPSPSVAAVLRERGVTTPITAIPTGIDHAAFASGDRQAARRCYGIPPDAFVVGHLGRLAPEKNLHFLAEAVAKFLSDRRDAHFLLVGDGPVSGEMIAICQQAGVGERLHRPDGELKGQALYDAYRAMDVYAFSSHSETQGMVLAEAMAAGVPVVAIDAPGARDIVRDRENGRLLADDNLAEYVAALGWLADLGGKERAALDAALARTAQEFSIDQTVRQLIEVYEEVCRLVQPNPESDTAWNTVRRRIGTEIEIWKGVANALASAISSEESSV